MDGKARLWDLRANSSEAPAANPGVFPGENGVLSVAISKEQSFLLKSRGRSARELCRFFENGAATVCDRRKTARRPAMDPSAT